MRFDRSKPFGEIRGMSGIAGYMQGGREFDTQGNLVAADPSPPAPKPQKPPAPPAAPAPQPPAEGEGQDDRPTDEGEQPQPVEAEAKAEQDAGQQDQPVGDQPATDAPAGAVTPVHVGAGRWVVMSADKQRLTDTMSRDEVDAWIAANAPQPPAEGEGRS